MRYLLYCEKLCVTLFTLWLKKMNKSECDNNSFLIMRKNRSLADFELLLNA